MKSKTKDRTQGSSSRISRPSSWTRAVLATLLVLAGIAAASVTVLARRENESGLAAAAAVLSLIIAALLTIFIVPPLARSARLEFAGVDFWVEPTSGGGVFLVIIVVVGFAAWNTGNNLLFLVFSLLCSTLFVGGAAARASLRDLIVSARFPDHIFAADAAPVIVTLRNAKRLLPSFSILVAARGPSDLAQQIRKRRGPRFSKRLLAYFTYVPHHAAAEQRVEQVFPKRGHVLITGFELSTLFPFGFFRFRRRLRARDVDIVVYPKPEPIGDELHLLPTFAGRMVSPRRGIGQDLFSLRDYQPQDDLRHIDWKATARSRQLTVREFTAEDERRITIVLDTRLTDDIEEENFRIRFESGVTQTASLVQHFIDERAEVSLVLGMERGRFGIGQEHLYACLRRLALVQTTLAPTSTSHLQAMLDSATRSEHREEANYLVVLTTAARGSIPPA